MVSGSHSLTLLQSTVRNSCSAYSADSGPTVLLQKCLWNSWRVISPLGHSLINFLMYQKERHSVRHEEWSFRYVVGSSLITRRMDNPPSLLKLYSRNLIYTLTAFLSSFLQNGRVTSCATFSSLKFFILTLLSCSINQAIIKQLQMGVIPW